MVDDCINISIYYIYVPPFLHEVSGQRNPKSTEISLKPNDLLRTLIKKFAMLHLIASHGEGSTYKERDSVSTYLITSQLVLFLNGVDQCPQFPLRHFPRRMCQDNLSGHLGSWGGGGGIQVCSLPEKRAASCLPDSSIGGQSIKTLPIAVFWYAPRRTVARAVLPRPSEHSPNVFFW